MHRSLYPALALATVLTAACSGGAIHAQLTLPRPGGVTQNPDGSITMTSGVVVNASDNSPVCQRVRIRVYTSATQPAQLSNPPAGLAPVAEGRAIGSYSAEKPQCSALAVNLPPRNDYWMVVEYPPRSPGDPSVSYYTLGKPSPFPPPTLAAGFYPVKVVDKQTTELSSTLSPR